MTKYYLILIVVLIHHFSLANTDISVDSAWGEWTEVRHLYDQGEFNLALEALLTSPKNNASYFYNLGNIYFRLDRIPMAVAQFEKANILHPLDTDIRHNLKVSQDLLKRRLGIKSLDPSSNWLENITDSIRLQELRGVLGIVVLLLTLMWIRLYYQTRSIKKVFLKPASYVGFLALGITLAMYGATRVSQSTKPIILIESSSIRSGPGEDFLKLVDIPAGIKLRAMEKTAKESSNNAFVWRQVRYDKNSIGWVKESSILIL